MKNKIKHFFTILGVTAGCLLFASFSPSLDGRAVVVDNGVFPQGLFAKTVGYLPGDIISVTNIAGDTTIDLLVIGALDPSEGVAIMLSPEAADAMGIDKGSNNIVKITKRSGQDERVYGNAVISKSAAEIEDWDDGDFEDVSTEENTDAFDDAAENEEDSDFEEAEEFEEADEFDEAEDFADEEDFEEADDYEEDDFDADEEDAEADLEEAEEDFDQPEEEVAEEAFEDEEAFDEEYPEEEYDEEALDEESDEESDEDAEDEAFDEEEAEEYAEEYTEETPEELEEPAEEEAFEDEELEQLPEDEEEAFEEEAEDETEDEELPAEEAFDEEAVEEEKPEELPEETEESEEIEETEDSEELPSEEAFEADELESLPEESESVTEESESDTEEYEAIVLVPVDSNPPESDSDEVEDLIESEELESIEEEAVIEPVEESKDSEKENKKETATSYDKYIVPSLKDLESGKYYIQIAVYGSDENILDVINKYGSNYPITIVPMAGGKTKQVLVGPVTMDEYKVVLERFKSYGFKDAFLRKIK